MHDEDLADLLWAEDCIVWLCVRCLPSFLSGATDLVYGARRLIVVTWSTPQGRLPEDRRGTHPPRHGRRVVDRIVTDLASQRPTRSRR
jgi:acyl CoA:acetate/3-ketoacid CoA transferase beta subunit